MRRRAQDHASDSEPVGLHIATSSNQIELCQLRQIRAQLSGPMMLQPLLPHNSLALPHSLILQMNSSQHAMDADLMGLGEHCSLSSCQQVDFLPFKCLGCGGTFCLEHRANHSCPSSSTQGGQVIVCPICAKGVRLVPGQDANAAFDSHSKTSGCDPANYGKVHEKKRCPTGRCQEKLTLTNTYRCKKCNERVCLKHRDPSDHNCTSIKTSTASTTASLKQPAQASASSPRPLPPPSSLQAQPSRHANNRGQTTDPLNTVKGTAERRREMVNGGVNPSMHQAPMMSETCPMCSARFTTVERLVQHVEEFHPTNNQGHMQASVATSQPTADAPSRAAPWSYQYRCEFCQRGFHEAVDVLHHSERCPKRSTQGSCSSSNCEIC